MLSLDLLLLASSVSLLTGTIRGTARMAVAVLAWAHALQDDGVGLITAISPDDFATIEMGLGGGRVNSWPEKMMEHRTKDATLSLAVRWLLNPGLAPQPNVCISVCDGRIVEVTSHRRRKANLHLGNVIALPGFANAHCHLDLSGLRGASLPNDFVTWLRGIITYRLTRSPRQIQDDIRGGLLESLSAGVSVIGDISAGGASWELLAAGPAKAVVFYELIGLTRSRAHKAWTDAKEWLRVREATRWCSAALSPHAPYSVRKSLFRAAAHFGKKRIPGAVHLAESPAELELLASATGPLAEMLKELGTYDMSGLIHNVEQILEMWEGNSLLAIHGNYLQPRPMPGRQVTLVFCPRTHQRFGHPRYPLEQWINAGVRVALGTDSLASAPTLDLLAEARTVRHMYPMIPPDTVLDMATRAGAVALGWGDLTGMLVPGNSADLLFMSLDLSDRDPYHVLFDSDRPISGVMIAGDWIRCDLLEISSPATH